MAPSTAIDRQVRTLFLRALYLMDDHSSAPEAEWDSATERGRLLRRACGDYVVELILTRMRGGQYPPVGTPEWPGWRRRAIAALREGHEPPRYHVRDCIAVSCLGCPTCVPAPDGESW